MTDGRAQHITFAKKMNRKENCFLFCLTVYICFFLVSVLQLRSDSWLLNGYIMLYYVNLQVYEHTISKCK